MNDKFNWDDLRFCLGLFRYGTMRETAERLDTNTATVSRRIERLTEHVGAPLFVKDRNRWRATDLGALYARYAADMSDNIAWATRDTHEAGKRVTIRLNASLRLLQLGLLNELWSLLDSEPNLNFQIGMGSASLAFGDTDLMLTTQEPQEGRLIRRKIVETEWRVYGHKQFEGAYKGWIRLLDLDDTSELSQQPLFQHFAQDARIYIHGLNLLTQISKNAPLISYMPVPFAMRNPDLIQIEDFAPQPMSVWLAYHQSRKMDAELGRIIAWFADPDRRFGIAKM